MANFYKSEVVTVMREQVLVPVFYNPDKEVVLGIIAACARGGSRLVEFTNRGEGAADLFGEVIKVCRTKYPTLMVGVGSVRDEVTAGIYIGKGADYVVGPTFNPKIAEICNRHAVSYSPGCGSATEINNAEACGSEIIKVFPGAQVGGPGFFKAVHGPASRTQMMPTGGVDVTAESIHDWLSTGKASALGIGSKLVRKDLVAKKDFAGIEDVVRKALGTIRAVRAKMLAQEGVIFVGVQSVGVPTEDVSAAANLLGDVAGLTVTKCSGSTARVAGRAGASLELGSDADVGENGYLSVEVTDIDKALEVLAGSGIRPDGKPEVSSGGAVKSVCLAEGAFGLKMRVRLCGPYSEELEKLLRK